MAEFTKSMELAEEHERLLKAVLLFCQEFEPWILAQPEAVKFQMAMRFGIAYEKLRKFVELAEVQP